MTYTFRNKKGEKVKGGKKKEMEGKNEGRKDKGLIRTEQFFDPTVSLEEKQKVKRVVFEK